MRACVCIRARRCARCCVPTGRGAIRRSRSALTALGRSGVPVYVLYRKGREPLLLPEVLQRQALIDAIAGS